MLLLKENMLRLEKKINTTPKKFMQKIIIRSFEYWKTCLTVGFEISRTIVSDQEKV